MTLSERRLQEKIAGAKRLRKMAFLGLAVGVALFMVGLLLPFGILFLVGYTVFMVCTGASSFLTVMKWQYTKALKTETEKREKPSPKNLCSRCGTEVEKNEKYCPKCGKKAQTRKR
jgi:uncharacterized paraquat-inducible protein A